MIATDGFLTAFERTKFAYNTPRTTELV